MSANERRVVGFVLSPGNGHDAPCGRELMEIAGKQKTAVPLLMDRAYEDGRTRHIAQTLRFNPVVPPKKNRKNPWEYDKELYEKRNEIERLFRLLQAFRRVFCRFDKLDIIFTGFIQLALIFITIR